MEFVRKKKRGQNGKVQRTWFSEEGYRVFWRKERYGVALTPAYMACVRVVVPNVGQDVHSLPAGERVMPKTEMMWDFVDRHHHLHKKMKTAQEACEKHKRVWTKACEATGIRGLVEIFGKVPSCFPLWVRKLLPRKVLEVLTRPPNLTYDDDEEVEACPSPVSPEATAVEAGSVPSPSDPIKISPTLFKNTTGSESPPESPPASTPASPAEAEAGTMTPKTRRVRSKGTATEIPSPAPPAEAAAKGRGKPASKPTAKPSSGSKRKPTTTKKSSKSAKKPSANSRKKKSKASKS